MSEVAWCAGTVVVGSLALAASLGTATSAETDAMKPIEQPITGKEDLGNSASHSRR
jgi:hypothetical protein